MRTALTALSLAALTAATPARAQDSLQSCRAVADNAARLACYDALADAARVPAAAAKLAPPLTTARPAPTAMAATAVATAPVAVPARTGEAAFGLPEPRRPDAVDAVESALPASFGGWGPNSRIKLANGQVWKVVDGSSVVLPEGPRKVSVKRGALGSFYLDIEGLKTSPRVMRVE